MPPDASAVKIPSRAPALLIVDDEPLVRFGLLGLFRASPLAWREVHAVATGAQALRHVQRTRPDLVLLDVDLAGEDGLALLPALRAAARVVVLSSHDDATVRARALRLGAQAFVAKHAPAKALLAAVQACLPAPCPPV